MKKIICILIAILCVCHAQQQAEKKPEPKKFPEEVLQTPPVVFAIGHDYQIMVPVITETLLSCEING